MVKTDYDDVDVPAALKRETADGSGFEDAGELPPSDFDSFPEGDAENDHDGDNIVSEEEENDK